MNTPLIDTILFINNPVSARMAAATLEHDGVSLDRVALFLLRKLPEENWFNQCGQLIRYPHSASLTLLGQRKFIGYYWHAASALRKLLSSNRLTRIYLANNDNLLTNHVLHWAVKHPQVQVSVIAEGIMNFQDIQMRNRAAWRLWTKPLLAAMLGLRWRTPTTHLSGAFEPAVARIISFSAAGLHAPADKMHIIPFPPVIPRVSCRSDTVLFAETALWQWMPPEQWSVLATAFATWIKSLGYSRLIIKPHPNYPPSKVLRDQLPPHETLSDPRGLETMAGDLDCDCIVGTCCTALVTLKQLRPDLRCIDFGSDHYLTYAYHNDQSVINLMQSIGVERVSVGCDKALR